MRSAGASSSEHPDDTVRLPEVLQQNDASTKVKLSRQKRRTKILSVFSVASLLELSETWWAVQLNNGLDTVCNTNAMTIRMLAADVDEEFQHSSKPLFKHCCAACGRLLSQPITRDDHKGTTHGLPGPAKHLRGLSDKNVRWTSIPPCLLLWSKSRLHATLLRGISSFNAADNRLQLTCELHEVPWLNIRHASAKEFEAAQQSGLPTVVTKQHDGRIARKCLNTEAPWWYCSICHAYYHPKPQGVDTVAHRIPMRNYWEGMFTCWHQDLAYPILHKHLESMYPKRRFPTPDQALDWRSAFQERHALINKLNKIQIESDPAEDVLVLVTKIKELKAQMVEFDDTWSPTPQQSEWKNPIPRKIFS